MTVNTASLAFWILVRIWATPGLVEQLRDEIATVSKTSQPVQRFAILEPPRLQIAGDGLSRSCPLLKACYLECVRLYSIPISVRSVKRPFTLIEPASDQSPSAKSQSFLMEAGDHIAIPFVAQHFDPLLFPSPNAFQPERFLEPRTITINKNKILLPSIGADRLQLPKSEQCLYPQPASAETEILAFVAGILALWDFEPIGSNTWAVPEPKQSVGIALPSREIRVRLRRRQLA